jgi:hypothetical protein
VGARRPCPPSKLLFDKVKLVQVQIGVSHSNLDRVAHSWRSEAIAQCAHLNGIQRVKYKRLRYFSSLFNTILYLQATKRILNPLSNAYLTRRSLLCIPFIGGSSSCLRCILRYLLHYAALSIIRSDKSLNLYMSMHNCN